jgi:hypothetical protein
MGSNAPASADSSVLEFEPLPQRPPRVPRERRPRMLQDPNATQHRGDPERDEQAAKMQAAADDPTEEQGGGLQAQIGDAAAPQDAPSHARGALPEYRSSAVGSYKFECTFPAVQYCSPPSMKTSLLTMPPLLPVNSEDLDHTADVQLHSCERPKLDSHPITDEPPVLCINLLFPSPPNIACTLSNHGPLPSALPQGAPVSKRPSKTWAFACSTT